MILPYDAAMGDRRKWLTTRCVETRELSHDARARSFAHSPLFRSCHSAGHERLVAPIPDAQLNCVYRVCKSMQKSVIYCKRDCQKISQFLRQKIVQLLFYYNQLLI